MRKIRITLAVIFFLTFAGAVSAQELMSLEDVEHLIESSPNKEVKAYFKSVERGTKQKRYDIILRGILKEPGFKVIMFVTTEKIVAGMSGSPVYINDKLIGAMAYGFNNLAFSDWWWGGVQPINSMIEQAESGRQLLTERRTFSFEGMLFEPIPVGYRNVLGLESLAGIKLMVTSGSDVQRVSTGAKKPVLESGMPIVVDLIEWTDERGELTIVSAMGTITYIDKHGKIYAFGHPFLGSRNVVYSFRTAEVMGTVYSQGPSYKLTGKISEILGAITYDASYGISGFVSPDELTRLNRFSLEFKSEGKPLHRFEIKVANSILTPLLAQFAFSKIGETNGAPIPQEASVTQLEARIDLEGYRPIVLKELFPSREVKFGPSTTYTSSYDVAHGYFFSEVYRVLLESKYGLRISDVFVSVNFIPGPSQTLRVGNYKFPNKVAWGQDPILEILLVDQNNLKPIAKKASVKIDWDKVEKPVYTKNTIDTEKAYEKIIRGSLNIESTTRFFQNLANSEKQKIMPRYFLGAEDFLDKFSRTLEATNQKLFVKVVMKSRSGLLNEEIASATDILPGNVSEDNAGWHVIDGGLTERKATVNNESFVIFYLDLPQIPNGYVIDQNLQEIIFFEIVLK